MSGANPSALLQAYRTIEALEERLASPRGTECAANAGAELRILEQA